MEQNPNVPDDSLGRSPYAIRSSDTNPEGELHEVKGPLHPDNAQYHSVEESQILNEQDDRTIAEAKKAAEEAEQSTEADQGQRRAA